MNKNHEVKAQQVADIVEKLNGAQSVVICSYSGLTVEQVTELRKQCREQDVHYCVLKNRLFARALKELNIEGLDDLLEGPNAFVFGMKDAVAAPKIVNEFIEKNKLESLQIRGGLLGTEAVDVKTIKSLAALPSREVLLAKLLGSLNNPISSFVRVVEAVRKQKAGE
jgi:large subunit ribosomal protein L10